MSLKNLISAVNDTIKELEREIPDITTRIGLNALEMASDRVVETGKDYKGSKLGDYSRGYAKKRQDKGRETAFVNLSYSGKMWRQMGITEKKSSKNTTLVAIGPTTEYSKKVSEYNTKRYGNFLRLNDSEIEELQEELIFEIDAILQRNFSKL